MRHRRFALALAVCVAAGGLGGAASAADLSPKVARDVSPKVFAHTTADKSELSPPRVVSQETAIEKVQRLIPERSYGGAYLKNRRYQIMVTDPALVPALEARFNASMDFVVVKHSLQELDRQMMVVFRARYDLAARGVQIRLVDGNEVTNTLDVDIDGPITAKARDAILKVVPGAPLVVTNELSQSGDRLPMPVLPSR